MNIEAARALYHEAKQLAGLASEQWTISYNSEAGRPEVYVRDTATGEITPIAQLLPDISYDDRMLLSKAPELLTAAITVCERAFDEIRRLKPKESKKKFTEANRCAMWCADNLMFARWLMAATDLHDASDSERIKTHVRFLLRIQSLAEIDTNKEAAGAWTKMRADFTTWRNAQ